MQLLGIGFPLGINTAVAGNNGFKQPCEGAENKLMVALMMVRKRQLEMVISWLLLSALLTASPAITTLAAATITASTDKSSYYSGQVLTVSGTVSPVTSGQDVAITVSGPASELRLWPKLPQPRLEPISLI